jgi:hypothetical protein
MCRSSAVKVIGAAKVFGGGVGVGVEPTERVEIVAAHREAGPVGWVTLGIMEQRRW